MPTVTPLNQIQRRMSECGRIRMGEKTAKAMRYLERFRFTSPNKELLDQVAALYGGPVIEWHEPKASPSHQWQVTIEDEKINVILPPEDAFSQNYESWVNSGAQRRCDGEWCEIDTPSGRDGEWQPDRVPCLCNANGVMECKPHTRLLVVLPGVDMRGVWRLETKGWNALHELPGMVDFIQGMAQRGRIVQAQLSIAKVEKMVKKKKSHFVVPKLELPFTPEQIVAGEATLGALEVGASDGSGRLALPPGPTSPGSYEGDDVRGHPDRESGAGHPLGPDTDDVIDGELVSEDELAVLDCAQQYGVDGHRLWQSIYAKTEGNETRIKIAVAKMQSGALQPTGFDAHGNVIWETS